LGLFSLVKESSFEFFSKPCPLYFFFRKQKRENLGKFERKTEREDKNLKKFQEENFQLKFSQKQIFEKI